MRKIVLIMMMLWTTFLTSCRTAIVCEDIERAEMVPLNYCDISFKFNEARCRCRCLDPNTYTTLPDLSCGEDYQSGNFELEACQGIAGFSLDDVALEVKPNISRLNKIKEHYCK